MGGKGEKAKGDATEDTPVVYNLEAIAYSPARKLQFQFVNVKPMLQLSPVTLRKDKAIKVNLDIDNLKYYKDKECTIPAEGVEVKVVEDLEFHLLNLAVENGPYIKCAGIVSQLTAIHIHSGAEHDVMEDEKGEKVKDTRNELHMKHLIVSPEDANRKGIAASSVGSTTLVIARFFNSAKKEVACGTGKLKVFGELLSSWKKNKCTPVTKIDPQVLLPTGECESNSAYYYQGSLTSGHFDQNVTWIVFTGTDLDTPSEELLEIFKAHQCKEDKKAPLNRRIVLRNF